MPKIVAERGTVRERLDPSLAGGEVGQSLVERKVDRDLEPEKEAGHDREKRRGVGPDLEIGKGVDREKGEEVLRRNGDHGRGNGVEGSLVGVTGLEMLQGDLDRMKRREIRGNIRRKKWILK